MRITKPWLKILIFTLESIVAFLIIHYIHLYFNSKYVVIGLLRWVVVFRYVVGLIEFIKQKREEKIFQKPR